MIHATALVATRISNLRNRLSAWHERTLRSRPLRPIRPKAVTHRSLCLLIVLVSGLATLSPGSRLTARAAQQLQQIDDGISAEAIAQINALLAEKASRTPVQEKIDSLLIYAQKMAKGQAIASGVSTLEVALPKTTDGRLEIDVRAKVTDDLINRIESLGTEVVEANARYEHLLVRASIDQVEEIAALDDVIFVRPKPRLMASGFPRVVQTHRS